MKKQVLIAPNATIVGDVVLGKDVIIWYGAVLRGDNGRITVGDMTNIQDCCVIHDETTIGSFCTLGHGAVVSQLNAIMLAIGMQRNWITHKNEMIVDHDNAPICFHGANAENYNYLLYH